MKHTAIASLLAVIAVLLGLNLIVKGSPQARADRMATAGPAAPTPVSIAMMPHFDTNDDPLNTYAIVRLWSDGSVDYTDAGNGACAEPSVCAGPTQIIPGTCTADVNHNGEVEVNDLITLLGEWGPCD